MDEQSESIKYVEPEPVPEEPARKLVQIVENNEPMKPWTLISRVDTDRDDHDVRVNVLKPLVLEGVLTPNADGDIRVYDIDKLEGVV
jgi:hypothetical protein